MHIKNAKHIQGLASEHGEVVYELMGHAAGGGALYSLAQIVLPPGTASRRHYHPLAEEGYYVLSGNGRMVIDDETALLGPGDSVAILPTQVHQLFNQGDTPLVFLAVCVPAWTPENSVYLD